MKTIQLTTRQAEVVRTIRAMQRSLRRAPTQRQVGEALGIARRTACNHINNLADKGAVAKFGYTNAIKIYELKA